jgi:hypothetical protein
MLVRIYQDTKVRTNNIIQKRLYDEENLLIENVHSHWKQVMIVD